MLDNYERGLTTAACDEFFAALRQKLVPLIHRVTAHADRVDDAPLHADFPIPIQREFSDFVMDVMGIDRNHCTIGETEHPFTINFSRDDVRITTHYHADMVASSLFSVIHEGGHALYELHPGRELARSSQPVGSFDAVMMKRPNGYLLDTGYMWELYGPDGTFLEKSLPVGERETLCQLCGDFCTFDVFLPLEENAFLAVGHYGKTAKEPDEPVVFRITTDF